MHALATLWIYTHREQYLQQLRAEYESLGHAEQSATGDAVLRLQTRRINIANEIRALANPFRLRSLWATIPNSATGRRTDNAAEPSSSMAQAA